MNVWFVWYLLSNQSFCFGICLVFFGALPWLGRLKSVNLYCFWVYLYYICNSYEKKRRG